MLTQREEKEATRANTRVRMPLELAERQYRRRVADNQTTRHGYDFEKSGQGVRGGLVSRILMNSIRILQVSARED